MCGLLSAAGLTHAQSPRVPVGPTPSRTGYVIVDSSRLFYEECGAERDGSPSLVLVHDGLMGAASWDLIWPTLCARAHVVRYDRRGVGRSTGLKVEFSQVADLDALLTDRGIARVTVVGSSAGGGLSLEYALAHPERVERLVLLGPVVDGLGFSQHFTQRERRNLEPLARGDVAAAIETQLADPFGLAPGDTAARRFVRATLTASPQNLRNVLTVGRFQERPDVPAGARLGDVRVPTLILVGEHDIPDVHAHAGAIEYGVGSARREVISGGGHLVQLDHAALVGPRLLAFVDETPIARVPVERLRAVAGTYGPFTSIAPGRFLVQDGRLIVRVPGSRDVPLFPVNDSTYYAVTTATAFRVTFHRAAGGAVGAADLDFGTVTRRATPVTTGR